MYAVIRTGGKQYKVAPGDVIKIETTAAENGTVEFSDILAVAGDSGITKPNGGAKVVGEVVEEGRGDKIIVFKFKRKKQYKKTIGHRQNFTAVRIAEISFDGQTHRAEGAAPKRAAKPRKSEEGTAAPKKRATKKSAAKK